MTKRGPKLLGGRVKPDETMQEALTREIAEETGLRVTVRDPVLVHECHEKHTRSLIIVFRVHVFGGFDAIKPERGIKPAWVPRGSVVGWNRPLLLHACPLIST
jgi:ADP-ribose pyrophosphatase YjhB (NUDIX family)